MRGVIHSSGVRGSTVRPLLLPGIFWQYPAANTTSHVGITVTVMLSFSKRLFIFLLSCAVLVDDGLRVPIRVLYEHKSASQAPDIPDLPLYHMPC